MKFSLKTLALSSTMALGITNTCAKVHMLKNRVADFPVDSHGASIALPQGPTLSERVMDTILSRSFITVAPLIILSTSPAKLVHFFPSLYDYVYSYPFLYIRVAFLVGVGAITVLAAVRYLRRA